MTDKDNFYLTFCRKHQHRDGYIRIMASTYDSAYKTAVAKFGMNWQQIRAENVFDKTKYRKGEILVIEGG
jgi:hypothetical protein